MIYSIKKTFVTVIYWDKGYNSFCGTTRFGANAPTRSMYLHTCSLCNGWRFRQALLIRNTSDFLPALASPFSITFIAALPPSAALC